MDTCSFNCILSIVVVGVVWGATNPLLRIGSTAANKVAPRKTGGGRLMTVLYDFWNLARCWKFAVPFALNQSASILFHSLVAKYPISVVVPTTNSVQLMSTAVCGHFLGEQQGNPRMWLGCLLSVAGIITMMVADGF